MMGISKNVAEKFSNYRSFQIHFGDLVIEKVGRDEYAVHRPEKDTWSDWMCRGSKDYVNGWMYGAVMRECGWVYPYGKD